MDKCLLKGIFLLTLSSTGCLRLTYLHYISIISLYISSTNKVISWSRKTQSNTLVDVLTCCYEESQNTDLITGTGLRGRVRLRLTSGVREESVCTDGELRQRERECHRPETPRHTDDAGDHW